MKVRIRPAAGVVRTLLVCLALSACTTTVAGQPRPAGTSGAATGDSDTAGAPGKAARPVDRDMQAVTVALRRLDACALFDLDLAKQTNPHVSVLPTGPHACILAPLTTYSPGDYVVKVSVGQLDNALVRSTGAPIAIAGAKAYERRDYSRPTSKECYVDLPVSFQRGIQYSYRTGTGGADPCQVVRQIATAAVPRLQNPDAITVDPAKRPFAGWDGCFFLAQLLGPEAQNFTYKPYGLYDPFSGCQTTAKKQPGALPPSRPNSAPLTGGNGSGSQPPPPNEPKLEIAYEQAPEAPKQPRQIAGKTADVTTYSTVDLCKLSWNQGESKTGNKWHAALVFNLTAATCDSAAQLAERAVALADQQPSDATAAPQRPLLFKPEDNDSPEPGTCVNWRGPDGCEPYHPVPVPHGIERILPAGNQDPNISCAVFQDAVKSVFGPSLNPVTWAVHCIFVEATLTLQLLCNVDSENPPSGYGRQTDVYRDRQEIHIAGKPAVTFWNTLGDAYDIYLSPYGDLSRGGNLHIRVLALPGRGDISQQVGHIKLDPAKTELAKQVIAHITQKYLPG